MVNCVTLMLSSRAVLFAAMLVFACDDTGSRSRTVPADAGGDASAISICDGSADIRLAIRIAGGGPGSAGMTMLSENGFRLLLIDGACDAWILNGHNDPLRILSVSRAREQQLIAALRLGHWGEISTFPGGGCADAPAIAYRFADERISGPVCGLANDHPLHTLNEAFAQQVQELYAAGTPVSGKVRYLLIEDNGEARLDARRPFIWQLNIPADAVPLSKEEATFYRGGNSQQATGTDAERLRGIRTTTANGTLPNGTTLDFTTIAGPDNTLYLLYIRDALPFEDDSGLLPPTTF